MTTDLTILKPNKLIEQTHRFTLLQMRVINVLLHNARDKLESGVLYKIHVDELFKHLDLDLRNESYLKVSLRDIMSKPIEWNIIKDNGSKSWNIAHMMSFCRLEKGYLSYRYCPELIELFEERLDYTLLSLEYQVLFQSKHTLAIWELCQRYKSMLTKPGDPKSTGWIEVKSLRSYLGIEKDEYPQFFIMNRDVIKKAVKEINAKADILVEVEYRRHGKQGVGSLRFLFQEKDQVIETPVAAAQAPAQPKVDPVSPAPRDPEKAKAFFEQLKKPKKE